ncbi:MAG TPA: cell division protein FtsA [Bryobacteraceae bacterium]|nr:cell division protein FtsA [Bryobacteraceae bacterium]
MSNQTYLAVGVDAGSWRTRCVISLLEGKHLRYLGHGEAVSTGWQKGRITDQSVLSMQIQQAVRQAERMAGVSVEAVVLGVGGGTVHGGNSHGIYEFGKPREVEPEDLTYAMELASRVRLEYDRMVLQIMPQDFIVDGRAGYRKPKRMTCSRLEANVHIVTTSVQEHQCLVEAVHDAHLAVEETVLEPMAASYAAILPEDRSRGAALVDIGLHSTDLVIYDGDAVALAATLPVAGDHFTRDIAWLLKVSYDDAERLKQEYGCALLGLTGDTSFIEVPSPESRGPREVRRRELIEILEARAEELFEYVRTELAKASMEQGLLEGVVLSGGGTNLTGMCDMAERVLNCPARIGLPVGIDGWPIEIDSAGWTTAAGLSMYSARLKTRRDFKRRAPGLVGMLR